MTVTDWTLIAGLFLFIIFFVGSLIRWLQIELDYRKLNKLDCPKQRMGYRCRHEILDNGKKECGL